MKVLVADKFEKSGIEGLKKLGCEVLSEPDLQGDELAARVKETKAEVLIVRSTKVQAPALKETNLALVIRAGAGVNTIDIETASAEGIRVANCPGKNSIAVAELAIGLLISCDRHIPDNVGELRAGKWNKKQFSKAAGLYGRTLGVIGMGAIGQEVIGRAKAFGMNIVVHSRWMTEEAAEALGLIFASSVEQVAALSDAVTVHVALTPETKGLLGAKFFESLKPGAIFLNTSRAEVVDQAAMEKAVKEKGILCGLDVFEGEPAGGEGTYEGFLRELPGVYCTHHIGASTDQAQEAIAAETVRIVREFKETGVVPNVVNVKRAEIATHVLVARHYDKVGVLADILGNLKEDGVSVQEMENIVLSGAKAAVANISLDKKPSDATIAKIAKSNDVLGAHLVELK